MYQPIFKLSVAKVFFSGSVTVAKVFYTDKPSPDLRLVFPNSPVFHVLKLRSAKTPDSMLLHHYYSTFST